MLYRCTECRQRSESKKHGNCLSSCSGYKPQQIALIHHQTPQGSALCTGNRITYPAIGVRREFGVSCIGCRKKLAEAKGLNQPPEPAIIPEDTPSEDVKDKDVEYKEMMSEGETPEELEPDDSGE